MKVCKIKEDYINYLRTKESKVLTNKNEKRPYIGVVYIINNLNYYIWGYKKSKFLMMV